MEERTDEESVDVDGFFAADPDDTRPEAANANVARTHALLHAQAALTRCVLARFALALESFQLGQPESTWRALGSEEVLAGPRFLSQPEPYHVSGQGTWSQAVCGGSARVFLGPEVLWGPLEPLLTWFPNVFFHTLSAGTAERQVREFQAACYDAGSRVARVACGAGIDADGPRTVLVGVPVPTPARRTAAHHAVARMLTLSAMRAVMATVNMHAVLQPLGIQCDMREAVVYVHCRAAVRAAAVKISSSRCADGSMLCLSFACEQEISV
jgi:hypothetical protein